MSVEIMLLPALIDLVVLTSVLKEHESTATRTEENYSLGVRQNSNGSYDIVSHWEKTPGKAQIESVRADVEAKIRQKYAYEKVKQELAKKGFTIATEEVQKDNTIRLVARKW